MCWLVECVNGRCCSIIQHVEWSFLRSSLQSDFSKVILNWQMLFGELKKKFWKRIIFELKKVLVFKLKFQNKIFNACQRKTHRELRSLSQSVISPNPFNNCMRFAKVPPTLWAGKKRVYRLPFSNQPNQHCRSLKALLLVSHFFWQNNALRDSRCFRQFLDCFDPFHQFSPFVYSSEFQPIRTRFLINLFSFKTFLDPILTTRDFQLPCIVFWRTRILI